MKISYNTLRELVDLSNFSYDDVGTLINSHIVKVQNRERVLEAHDSVFASKIVEINKHPNADNLSIVKVNINDENLEIVCGAANIRVGQLVPLIKTGSKLPCGTKLKKVNIRGVTSVGMICSEKELALGEDEDHIIELPQGTELGKTLAEIYKLSDCIYSINDNLLEQRPDLFSHLGFAKELSTICGRNLIIKSQYITCDTSLNPNIEIIIEDQSFCKRYSMLLLSELEILDSSLWIRRRLESLGIKPINNLLDISNLVMLEIGQPTMIFNAGKLELKKLIVTRSSGDFQDITSDGIRRSISKGTPLVCDNVKPINIAGIIGFKDVAIGSDTKRVLIESASFDREAIDKSKKNLLLNTEIAKRFSKGVNPELTLLGIDRILEYLKNEKISFKLDGNIIDNYKIRIKPSFISCSIKELQNSVDLNLEKEKIQKILDGLSFKVVNRNDDLINIEIPDYRGSCEYSDLSNEVSRIYGYHNIKQKQPLLTLSHGEIDKIIKLKRVISLILSNSFGFTEIISERIVEEEELEEFGVDSDNLFTVMKCDNRVSLYLRDSFFPSIIKVVKKNIHNFNKIRIYEAGNLYKPTNNENNTFICGILYERELRRDDQEKSRPYLTLKGILERLFSILKLDEITFTGSLDNRFFHPLRNNKIYNGNMPIGSISEIHPEWGDRLSLPGVLVMFELSLLKISSGIRNKTKFIELSKYPATKFNISVTCDRKVACTAISKIIMNVDNKLIDKVSLIDIYSDLSLGKDKKSLTYSILAQAKDKTLKEEDIKNLQERIIKKLNKHGFYLRGKLT